MIKEVDQNTFIFLNILENFIEEKIKIALKTDIKNYCNQLDSFKYYVPDDF